MDNPKWKAKWASKKAFGPDGKLAIEVSKTAGDSPYKVDALSGATITSNGVTYLLRFWLGENGFGPYIDHIRSAAA